MKNIKFNSLFAILIALFLGSCSTDFIEEKRDLTAVTVEIYQNEQFAIQYLDYVYYSILPGKGKSMPQWDPATGNDDFVQSTDELGGETEWNKVWAQIAPINNHALKYIGKKIGTDKNPNPWTNIRSINVYLQNVDKYSGINKQALDGIKGQLYFLRAWQYFELVKLYGGVPLVLIAQNPISGDESLETPRSSSAQCIDQIVADLDMAISLLPGKWSDSANWGRITSGGAAALKGRVLLTWASPLFNRNDDQARWQRSYDANLAAKILLEENGFGLNTNWKTMWFQEVNNPEAVISYGFNNSNKDNEQSKNNGTEKASRSSAQGGGGSIGPTKQIVDAFPMKDGKMPNDATGIYTYNANKFYKNRDPRFYNTFAYNGAIWPYKEASNFKNWTYSWYKSASDLTPKSNTETSTNGTGIYLRKFTNATSSNENNFGWNGDDYMELRFAEVVLNLAESAVGVGGAKLTEGKQGIIDIRKRAGVENADGFYGLANVITRDQHFEAIINERKVEFAYENKRFYDLRRWLLYDDTYGTCTRLNQTPIDGSRRQGYYIVAKNAGSNYVGTADPFKANTSGVAPIINRDATTFPTGVSNYEQYVDYLYDNHFEVVVKDDIDKTTGGWTFKWYQEYYFFGIYQSLLDTSPYLEQTQGWGGSFNPVN